MTKAPTPTKMSKGQSDNTNNATISPIKQRLRTDLGRSVRVTTATQETLWISLNFKDYSSLTRLGTFLEKNRFSSYYENIDKEKIFIMIFYQESSSLSDNWQEWLIIDKKDTTLSISHARNNRSLLETKGGGGGGALLKQCCDLRIKEKLS